MQRHRREEQTRSPEVVSSTLTRRASPPLSPVLDTLVTAAAVVHGVGATLAKAGGKLLHRVGKGASK